MSRTERGQQLLDVAELVFGEHGYRGTSMDDIAHRAGVSKPILYDHYGSKEGLLAALVERAGEQLQVVVVSAATSASDRESALAAGIRSYFSFVEEHSPAWYVVAVEGPGTAARPALENLRAALARLVADLVVAELPTLDSVDARLYAEMLTGACERLAIYAQVDVDQGGGFVRGRPTLDVETLTARVMDVFWVGAASVVAGRRWIPPNDRPPRSRS
jgi:AcrR family transcriptional regulator